MELPPIYQRLAELRAIAEQSAIAAAFVDTPIERIEYVRVDLYRVTAGRCHLGGDRGAAGWVACKASGRAID